MTKYVVCLSVGILNTQQRYTVESDCMENATKGAVDKCRRSGYIVNSVVSCDIEGC